MVPFVFRSDAANQREGARAAVPLRAEFVAVRSAFKGEVVQRSPARTAPDREVRSRESASSGKWSNCLRLSNRSCTAAR